MINVQMTNFQQIKYHNDNQYTYNERDRNFIFVFVSMLIKTQKNINLAI